MRYLLMIYAPERPADEVPPDVLRAQMEAYDAYTRDLREHGQFEAGEALQPTNTATTVRIRDGQTLVTDGPFAETKEALGGFYLLQCRDLDEALELAARVPGAQSGSIEVRPIWELPSVAPAAAGEAIA